MLAVVAPGQGSQTPGLLAPWLDRRDLSERLAWFSAVTSLDLRRHGTTSDAEEIRDTAVAQPLLLATALLAWTALTAHAPETVPDLVGGHSVGELAAASLAGVLTHEQALVLVRERGRLMAEAAARTPTGMTAVLGGDPDEVLSSLAGHGLHPANVNGPGQVVAAGTLADLEALAQDPPPGARLRPLQVAGAFHTEHMAPAEQGLRARTAGLEPAEADVPMLSNADGVVVSSGRDVLHRLVAAVSTPVRWDRCMASMDSLGVTGLLELPPAGTLTGLARRALGQVATFALRSPDQLDEAADFAAAHADTGSSAGSAA